MITIILGRAAQFLLALIMMRVATTLLSPAEMGRVSLVLSTIAFFALFLVNPVGMFINRRLHAWQATGVAKHYLIRYVAYLLLVALVAAIVLRLFYMAGVVNFGIPIGWLLLLVCGSLLFNTINQTSIPSLNMLGDSKRFVMLSVATLATSFAFATLFVQNLQPAAQYWLLGLLIGQTVFAVIGTKVLFKKLHPAEISHALPTISKLHLKELFNFAWPVSIAAGLAWVQGQGYRYIIDDQLGLSQLGLFVAGYGISAGIIAAFESVLTTYFQPRLYRDVSGANPTQQAQAWHRYAAAVIPSLILTVALIMILAPELTRLLLGENFQSAANFLIWGALAEAARVLMGVYSLIAHVHMRTRWLIMPNIIGATLSISLSALLIPVMGAAGAG
ncbi:MAG: oligosaccharide flippase family protein, partial [Methylotenera sp.]|nr:oligosaccharide flippase family protein [Methylotenera sp.]